VALQQPDALTFGSGLVVVTFLQQGVEQQYGWLNERDFLVAVAVGMISPGRALITATFAGYLAAGFWESVAATVGIFLPSFILVMVAAPILARLRTNPNVQGFIKGAYAAAMAQYSGPACSWVASQSATGSRSTLRCRHSSSCFVGK
jgi:chromate transporter